MRRRGALLTNRDLVLAMQARKTSLGARSDRRTEPRKTVWRKRHDRLEENSDFGFPLSTCLVRFSLNTSLTHCHDYFSRILAEGAPRRTNDALDESLSVFFPGVFLLFFSFPCQTLLCDRGWQLTTATLKQSMLISQHQIFCHFLNCGGLFLPKTAICDTTLGQRQESLGLKTWPWLLPWNQWNPWALWDPISFEA